MVATSTKHRLSKSSFIRGLQCPKSLYFHYHNHELADPASPILKQTFSRGHRVGELAQQLFPSGIDVSPTKHDDFEKSVEVTKQLIEQGITTIYESFSSGSMERKAAAADIAPARIGANS